MSDTVFVNGRAVIHKESSGKSLAAFPDVCLCPPTPPNGYIPVPLVNNAVAADLAGGASSVTMGDSPIAKKSSYIARSTGDEAGSPPGKGGVATGVTLGKAYFQSYSMDVLIEGENVPRALDLCTHNHRQTGGNTPPWPWTAPAQPAAVPQQKPEHRFVWQAPFTAEVLQYVNLPAKWGPRNGPKVKVRGRVFPPKAGVKVEFEVVVDPKNDKLVLKPGLKAAAPEEPAPMTGSATSNAKGYVTFEFELPVYGGHRYRVAAKTDSMKVSVESGPITVWRKVFYQISEMDPPAGARFNFKANKGMIAALRSSLKPVYIALEKGVVARDRLPFQEHFSYTERSKVEAQLKPKAQDVRVPFKFNVVMIDKSDIWKIEKKTDTVTTNTYSTAHFYYYDDLIHYKGYREVGTSTWYNLSNVRFDPPNPNAWDLVQIHADLPGFVAGKQYEIYLQYDEATGHAGGWGGQTGTLFLCIGRARRQNSALPHAQDLQQVLAHELGHALGLVPQAAGWHDTDSRDQKYSLKHCDIGKKTPRCVMWFQLSAPGGTDKAERYHFCDFAAPNDCAHFLMGIPMTDSDLKWLK